MRGHVDEVLKARGARFRDTLALVQLIVGLGVVIGIGGNYFVVRDRVTLYGQRIDKIDQWIIDHERIASHKIEQVDELQRRVDDCCPRFRNGE